MRKDFTPVKFCVNFQIFLFHFVTNVFVKNGDYFCVKVEEYLLYKYVLYKFMKQ